MPAFSCRLFGSPTLENASGARVESLLAQPKRFAVLAYLLVEARTAPVSRDKVAAIFWPELDQARARQALRQSLHVIRGELGDDVITGVGAEAVVANRLQIDSDVARFHDAMEAGNEATALDEYRGHLLDGFFVSESPEFDQWMSEARARFRAAAVSAAKKLAERAEASGDDDETARRLQQQLALSDIDEKPLRKLMILLRKQGNAAAAIAAYDAYAERMHRELEVEPSGETAALAQEIRAEVAASGLPIPRTGTPYEPERPHAVAQPASSPLSQWPVRRLVGLGLVLAAAFVLFALRYERSVIASQPPSVAVLPFLDLSPGKDQAYFADGITEELITVLSRVRGLKVTARTSSFAYRDAQQDVPRIARELKVGSILEGSVRRNGEQLRVTAQLIDARTGFHIWADNFDRKSGDLFAVQDEIATAIARALRVQLVGTAPATSTAAPRTRTAAHDAYLRGRYFWNQRDQEGIRTAIGLFRDAVRIDSTFANAWAGLGAALHLAPNFSVLPPDSAFPQAANAINRALALDPESPEAHASRGFIKFQWERDWTGAERDLRKAIDLAPGYATAWQWLRLYYVATHRLDDALSAARRARELDPVSISIQCAVGDIFLYQRNLDSARASFATALSLDPEFDRALVGMSRVSSIGGNHAEAIAYAERAVAKPPHNSRYVGNLAMVYGRAGRSAEARQALDSLHAARRRGYVPPYAFFVAHMGLGNADSVAASAARMRAERDAFMIEVWAYPELGSLARDRRLAPLIARPDSVTAR